MAIACRVEPRVIHMRECRLISSHLPPLPSHWDENQVQCHFRELGTQKVAAPLQQEHQVGFRPLWLL